MLKVNKANVLTHLAAMAVLAGAAGSVIAANPCSGTGSCTTSPAVKAQEARLAIDAQSSKSPMKLSILNTTTGITHRRYDGGRDFFITTSAKTGHNYVCTISAPSGARVSFQIN